MLDRGASWFQDDEVLIGRDVQDGGLVRIPLGGARGGTHTLVLGAAGSGKTVTMTAIAVHAIEHGLGAVFVDPKSDPKMLEHARAVAEREGRPFVHWTPDGSVVYNPYAHGSETEIADKLLAGEQWSEPHYLRQAQRYLGHEVRVLRQAGIAVSLANIVRYLDLFELEVLVRGLPERLLGQVHGLSGVARRGSAERPVGRPRPAGGDGRVGRRAVAGSGDDGGRSFDLLRDDRAAGGRVLQPGVRSPAAAGAHAGGRDRPGPAERRGALQGRPIPTVVVIDEFSALAAEQVSRLFGRARAAGMSLLLGTQELADLRVAGPALQEQVMGNLTAVIAHRQVVRTAPR